MIKNKKTAVVYDKWLHTLGGGELVACMVASILVQMDFDVTLVCGKKIPNSSIKNKFNIDLSDISFVEIWNDEDKLHMLTQGKDIFINISFMDYSYGNAKYNIYYTHFPTVNYLSFKGFIFNKFALPIASHIVKPVQTLTNEKNVTLQGHTGANLYNQTRLSFGNLHRGHTYIMKFSVFVQNMHAMRSDALELHFENALIVTSKTREVITQNIITYTYTIKPQNSTVYLQLQSKKEHEAHLGHLLLVNAKILRSPIYEFLSDKLSPTIGPILSTGRFTKLSQRLHSYQYFIAHSEFVKAWIKKYWKKDAQVVYPIVDLLYKHYDLKKQHKENWIFSVGRFFKHGHNKKQEILIDAFIKLYKLGYTDWELHLAGGVTNDKSSIDYIKYLQKKATKYPITFHFNVSKKEIDTLYLRSKMYWHAAGFDEDEEKYPVKLEHFGIAPVEAISAGCTPILYKGGGLKEIIEKIFDNKDKHLFTTTNQLVTNAIYFIKQNNFQIDKETLNKVDWYFSKETFMNEIKNIVGRSYT